MVAIAFYTLIAIAVLLAFAGFTARTAALWLAGLLMYIACYLADVEVGALLMAAPVILWMYALAGTLRLLKRPAAYWIVPAVGAAVWAACYYALDAGAFFYPFEWVSANFYRLLRTALQLGD